jgi:hypothetical protein
MMAITFSLQQLKKDIEYYRKSKVADAAREEAIDTYSQ